MDEMVIRNNCECIKKHWISIMTVTDLFYMQVKHFVQLLQVEIAHQEGLGLDVVSGGELYTAIKAGFPMEKVYFHGNNKTIDEIEMGIDNNIGRFVVDNETELNNIEKIATVKGKKVKILFRIKPGIDANTHEAVMTGQIDSKFGVGIENGEAYDIIAKAAKMENIEVVGIHCHIGSQIFGLEPFMKTAEVMINFIADIRDKLNIQLNELNLGGGFGIRYTEKDAHLEYDKFVESVSKVVKKVANEKGIKELFILIEPGRSIVGSAGITLYVVGNVKNIEGIRKYISVDGGRCDNPRDALYESSILYWQTNLKVLRMKL